MVINGVFDSDVDEVLPLLEVETPLEEDPNAKLGVKTNKAIQTAVATFDFVPCVLNILERVDFFIDLPTTVLFLSTFEFKTTSHEGSSLVSFRNSHEKDYFHMIRSCNSCC